MQLYRNLDACDAFCDAQNLSIYKTHYGTHKIHDFAHVQIRALKEGGQNQEGGDKTYGIPLIRVSIQDIRIGDPNVPNGDDFAQVTLPILDTLFEKMSCDCSQTFRALQYLPGGCPQCFMG